MGFESGIRIGEEVSNHDIVTKFRCGNMGGMRRSKETGTLVIISDDTKKLYHDTWIDGTLHYTGMGKIGDQTLVGNQNGTLYNSKTNGVEVHLFEVMRKAVYVYRGVVALAGKPYQTQQVDNNGQMRKVWIFPVKPIDATIRVIENPVEKDVIKLSNRELARRFEINKGTKLTKRSEVTIYYRDPYLKAMVKRLADGKCQWCGEKAPFLDKNNEPYLEEHHVKQLADGGKDVIENVVAICPNCHRKAHILHEQENILVLEKIAEQNKNKLKRMLAYDGKR